MYRRLHRGLIGFALAVALPAAALANDTCNGLLEINYVNPQPVHVVGDVVRMRISLGTGTIQNGTKLTITSFEVDLDCDGSQPLVLP